MPQLQSALELHPSLGFYLFDLIAPKRPAVCPPISPQYSVNASEVTAKEGIAAMSSSVLRGDSRMLAKNKVSMQEDGNGIMSAAGNPTHPRPPL